MRLNVAATPSQSLSFQVNLHDARVGEKEIGPVVAPFRGPFDFRLAFSDIGSAKAPVAFGSAARNWPLASNACSATWPG